MSFLFSTTKYSSDVTTSNWLAVGHDSVDGIILNGTGKLILSASNGIIHLSGALDVGLAPDNKAYHLRTLASHLIFSSSGGSVVALSASQDFVNSDKAYHLRTVNSHLILSSSGGSYVYASGNLTVEQALLVKGDTVLSGNVVVGGQLYDLNSNLILSSSIGSIVALSASQDFVNSDKAYHIRAVNSHLIFSSSAGSVVALSASEDFVNSDKTYHVRAVNSHLILSSAVGSVVALSSSEDYVNSDKNYHIRAVNSSLILSSSAGSRTTVSGTLQVLEQITGSNITTNTGSLTVTGIMSSDIALIVKHPVDGQISLMTDSVNGPGVRAHTNATNQSSLSAAAVRLDLGGNYFFVFTSPATAAGTARTWTQRLGINTTRATFTDPVATSALSSSLGIAISGTLDCVETIKTYHLRAINSHLILSSSSGAVVTASGSIRSTGYASASMPSPSGTVPSGTIAYVSDFGFLALAWNGAWHRITTGSF